jgi:hypothetical protein
MALLFLRAKDHRINARALDDLKRDFVKLDQQACRGVVQTYHSLRSAGAARRAPDFR